MLIALVGMNHETAPFALRERAALRGDALRKALRELSEYDVVEACTIVGTCNRLEIYALIHERLDGVKALTRFLAERCGESAETMSPHLYVKSRTHAVRHLYRVAGGLESLVLGEDQILAQVKDAYAATLDAEAGNAILHELMLQAIRVGKRVRSETAINAHPLSLSSLAVELCAAELGELTERSVVVLGAGEMARLAVENLQARGVGRITVVNRSVEKARALCERVAERFAGARATAAAIDEVPNVLLNADGLIAATGAPGQLVDAETLHSVAQSRAQVPLVVVDMALPRDVDPAAADLPGIRLYGLDDLKNIAEKNRRARAARAARAAEIVDEELPSFLSWLESRSVVPTVAALQQRGEQVLDRELQRALNRFDGRLNERELQVLREMGRGIVKHLVNRPISELKRQAADGQGRLYAEIACELFDLRLESGPLITPESPNQSEQADEYEAGFG